MQFHLFSSALLVLALLHLDSRAELPATADAGTRLLHTFSSRFNNFLEHRRPDGPTQGRQCTRQRQVLELELTKQVTKLPLSTWFPFTCALISLAPPSSRLTYYFRSSSHISFILPHRKSHSSMHTWSGCTSSSSLTTSSLALFGVVRGAQQVDLALASGIAQERVGLGAPLEVGASGGIRCSSCSTVVTKWSCVLDSLK